MPKLDWLKREFEYGYDSGDILSVTPDEIRSREEKLIGGSYRSVFLTAILPYLKPDSVVLEIGPGRGSWTKAILQHIPDGKLHVLDYQNVEKWLKPYNETNRLYCHKIDDNSGYSIFQDDYFDFCWSFGVLCHNNIEDISEILLNSLSKMKSGAIAAHQYAAWEKLEQYGWEKGGIPDKFKSQPDSQIWWPRNTREKMSSIAFNAGWAVLDADIDLLERDAIILLQRQ